MFSNIKTFLAKHFSQHIMLYFLAILFFTIGISTGAFSVRLLSKMQEIKLIDYLADALKSTLLQGQIKNTEILAFSITNNLKTIIMIWIFAIFIITFPLIFIIVGLRGFQLGFTVGFLIQNLGYRGILISLVSILPQNLLVISGIIFLSVISIDYSVQYIKKRKYKQYVNNQKSIMLIKYSIVMIMVIMYISIGCLIESYVSPYFLKGISYYLIN